MKKIICFVAVLFLLEILNGCGYQPIYSSKNINLKIVNQSYEGNNDLAQRIYSKINDIIFFDNDAREVALKIFVSKNKLITSKDSSGKALSYKITLNAGLTMTDIFSDEVLANQNITLSESYKVQDQVFQTEKLENDIISNLIDRVGQEFLLKISQAGLSLDK